MSGSGSCEGRCGNDQPHPYYCGCDPDCVAFQDCCFDYFEICLEHNLRRQIVDVTLFSCSPLQDMEFSAMLISTCPSSWGNGSIKSHCETDVLSRYDGEQDLVNTWPIFDQQGSHYQNIYCAVCNGFSMSDVQPWDISSRKDTDYYRNSPNQQCRPANHTSKEIGSRPRFCSTETIKSCPNNYDNQTMADYCSSYINYICIGNKYYQNYHCYLCNNEASDDTDEQECQEKISYNSQSILQFIWQFQHNVFIPSQRGSTSCTNGDTIYDPYTRQCRHLSCAPGLVLGNNSECVVPLRHDYKLESICCHRQESWIVSVTDYNPHTDDDDTEVKHTCLLDIFSGLLDDLGTSWSIHRLNARYLSKVLLQNVDVACSMIGQLDTIVKDYADDLTTCGYYQLNYIFMGTNLPYTNSTCDGEWFEGQSEDFTEVDLCQQEQAEVFLFKQQQHVRVKTIIHHVSYEYQSHIHTFTKRDAISVCGDRVFPMTLECPVITITSEEYSFDIIQNGSRRITFRNITLAEDEYIICPAGRLQICANKLSSSSVTSLFEYHDYLDIVNIIGNSLSCCGFLIIFTIHCMFSKLRTFHGCAIMHLCVALLNAQVIPMLSQKLQTSGFICVFTAATSHLMWLSAFTWMSIISLNLFDICVFNPLLPVTVRREREASFVYRVVIPLFGWGIAIVIVLISIILHFYGSPDALKYSVTTPCWILRPSDNLKAFGIPVAITLSLNLILFIMIGISKCRNRITSAQLERTTTRKTSTKDIVTGDVKLFLKVSF